MYVSLEELYLGLVINERPTPREQEVNELYYGTEEAIDLDSLLCFFFKYVSVSIPLCSMVAELDEGGSEGDFKEE